MTLSLIAQPHSPLTTHHSLIRDLAIYGAGGFGREMALMVEQMNAETREWNLIGFFDDGKVAGQLIDELPVLGGMKELNQWKTPLAVVIGVADPQTRRDVVGKISTGVVDFPVMIHPSTLRGSAKNRFGRGTIVTFGCVLTTGIELGEFVLINAHITLGHDVKISDYVSIMPGCNISGAVTVGEGSFVGTGAQVLQNLSIGENCKIGAGAVVTKSVESGKTVMGIPAREKP